MDSTSCCLPWERRIHPPLSTILCNDGVDVDVALVRFASDRSRRGAGGAAEHAGGTRRHGTCRCDRACAFGTSTRRHGMDGTCVGVARFVCRGDGGTRRRRGPREGAEDGGRAPGTPGRSGTARARSGGRSGTGRGRTWTCRSDGRSPTRRRAQHSRQLRKEGRDEGRNPSFLRRNGRARRRERRRRRRMVGGHASTCQCRTQTRNRNVSSQHRRLAVLGNVVEDVAEDGGRTSHATPTSKRRRDERRSGMGPDLGRRRDLVAAGQSHASREQVRARSCASRRGSSVRRIQAR
mmetsp:Transcript_4009/g.25199  ORF Transcript_4009/g.25199 Transcript_4009/m.25199 type:complete len:293 (-) Transcript_4009:2327-3205(-)